MTNTIRVLLVDDESLFVEGLAKVLRKRGIAAWTANNGTEAIECLKQNEFDVIVLDLCMPGMDGVATVQAIRRIDSITPVILLTGGHSDLDRVNQALKGGVSALLLKPCTIDTLASAIENASERKDALRDLAANQER